MNDGPSSDGSEAVSGLHSTLGSRLGSQVFSWACRTSVSSMSSTANMTTPVAECLHRSGATASACGSALPIHEILKSAEPTFEVAHVVKCFLCERFSDGARLLCIPSDHDDARIMVLHRQATVVFGGLYLSDVFTWQQFASGKIPSVRQAPRRKLGRIARIDEHCGSILPQCVVQAVKFGNHDSAQRAPNRSSELIAPHIRVARRKKVFAHALALPAEWAIAVQD